MYKVFSNANIDSHFIQWNNHTYKTKVEKMMAWISWNDIFNGDWSQSYWFWIMKFHWNQWTVLITLVFTLGHLENIWETIRHSFSYLVKWYLAMNFRRGYMLDCDEGDSGCLDLIHPSVISFCQLYVINTCWHSVWASTKYLLVSIPFHTFDRSQ